MIDDKKVFSIDTFEAKKNRPCDDCALWDEIDDLKEEVLKKDEQIRLLTIELDGYKAAEEKSKKRLLESDMEADRLKKTAQYKYLMELRGLKLFVDKIKTVYGDELSSEKSAITDLLVDFLKDVDEEGYLYKAKDNAQEILEKAFFERRISEEEAAFYGDESDFNLEEAINPTEELDLKSLLSELGVTGDK